MNLEHENMPHLWYDGKNIQTLVQDVRSQFDARSARFTARPYNYTRPLETEWWLIPSTAWPAFGLGKILFSPEGPDRILVALNVEKGFEAFTGVEKSKILGRRWAWHALVEAARVGSIQEAAQTVTIRSESPVQVILQLFTPNSPAGSWMERVQRDCVRWYLDGDRLALDGTPELGLQAAGSIVHQTSFGALVEELVDFPNAGWYWFDLAIGVWIGLGRAPDTGLECTAFDLAERLIVPWLPWVR